MTPALLHSPRPPLEMSPDADGFLVKDPRKELDTQGWLKLAAVGGWLEGEGEGGRARSRRPLGLHLGRGG